MNAYLVVNHFLTTPKYTALHSHLAGAAKKAGIKLEIKTNLELAVQNISADFVLFWDKDTRLARRIERGGTPVFNSPRSIELCDDKAKTYIELSSVVPQPETLISPLVYEKQDLSAFAESAAEILGLPLVFKECFGSFGQQVFLCKTVREITDRISDKPFILQKFIKSSFGRDRRLQVVGGEVVAAVERKNERDFRSNVTNGGTMSPCTPTGAERETALKACAALGLTFGGVDILGNGLVCEVNSNAHIINLLDSTGIDAAPYIFREIQSKL